MTDSFAIPWAIAPRLLCPWDFLGKNIGVDCHFLLQGIFPTQGSNPCLHVSCSAGGFLIAEPLGKAKVKSGKDKHHMVSLTWNLKGDPNAFIHQTETDS